MKWSKWLVKGTFGERKNYDRTKTEEEIHLIHYEIKTLPAVGALLSYEDWLKLSRDDFYCIVEQIVAEWWINEYD